MYAVNDIIITGDTVNTIKKITNLSVITVDQKGSKVNWTIYGFSNLIKKGYKIYTPKFN